jgi:hypothetical protein
MISNGRRTQENAVLLNDVGINDALSYDIGYWTELARIFHECCAVCRRG